MKLMLHGASGSTGGDCERTFAVEVDELSLTVTHVASCEIWDLKM